jgi:hypothetical protein
MTHPLPLPPPHYPNKCIFSESLYEKVPTTLLCKLFVLKKIMSFAAFGETVLSTNRPNRYLRQCTRKICLDHVIKFGRIKGRKSGVKIWRNIWPVMRADTKYEQSALITVNMQMLSPAACGMWYL